MRLFSRIQVAKWPNTVRLRWPEHHPLQSPIRDHASHSLTASWHTYDGGGVVTTPVTRTKAPLRSPITQKLIALVCTVGEAHHTHGSEVGSHFVPFALITTASQHGMQPPQHGTEATPTLAKRPRNSPVQLVHCVGAVETEQTEAFSGNDVQSPAERIDARAVARPGEHGFPLPPPLSCDMTAVICWPAEQSRPRSRCVFTVVEARTSQSHEPCEQQKRTVWHPSINLKVTNQLNPEHPLVEALSPIK